MAAKGQQEVLTSFGFTFDRSKFAGIQRGVKGAAQNLGAITARVDRFQQGMGSFFARARGIIGAYLGFRAVRAITSDYAKGADAVAKFATATGLSTETYQGLIHAVQIGGSDQENLNKALTQLSKRALEAGQGLKTNQRAFQELGISWNDAEGKLKSGDQLFIEMADGLVNLEDKEKRTGLAMQLLGRSGATLLPTMLEGSKGIKALIAEAKKLGKVLTKDQLKAAENYNDEMLRVKSVLAGVRNQIASAVLPVITRLLTKFHQWATSGDNLKIALKRLAVVGKLVGVVLAGLVAAKIKRALVGLYSMIKTGIGLFRAFGAAAFWAQVKLLLIPAAIALIFLAIEDLIGFAQGKDSLIGRLLGDTSLAKTLKESLIEIGRAVAKAWQDIKPALLEAWVAMKPALKELWKAIKPIIGPAFRAAVFVLVAGFQMLAIMIRGVSWAVTTLINTGKKFFGLWSGAIDKLDKGFENIGYRIEELAPIGKEVAKTLGIDFDKLSKAMKTGWSKTKSFFGDMFSSAIRGGERLLVIMGLIKGAPITWKARAKALVEAQPGVTSTGTPIMKGLLQPGGPETIFGGLPQTPVGALPGMGGPGGAPWLAVPTTQTAHVAPGAIQVVVNAKGDPKQIAEQVNRVVTQKVNNMFTDAYRDLKKPPAGQ